MPAVRRPKRPDAAVIVGAYNDAYVSQKSVRELAQHWPGSQVHTFPFNSNFTLSDGPHFPLVESGCVTDQW